MPLPGALQLSASSLQDYADCPRRFQLRHVLRVAWPAPVVEPIGGQERHSQRARDFHRLIHQHLLGLPIEALSASVNDPDLDRWWQAYLAYIPRFGSAQVIPEVGLSTVLEGCRVTAQYDAIVMSDQPLEQAEAAGQAHKRPPTLLILDWKTYRRRPSRAWLAQRLQTRVYPMVLVEAGAPLLVSSTAGNANPPIVPEDVVMCYWLAEYPEAPVTFPYDRETYQADRDHLIALVADIVGRVGAKQLAAVAAAASAADEPWPLTTDLDHCRFCNYRSLCGRGELAGPLVEYVGEVGQDYLAVDETDLEFDLDWGQVQEIAY